MKILVLNSGSSSVKFHLFDMQSGARLAAGLVEKIGEPLGRIEFRNEAAGSAAPSSRSLAISDHRRGLELALESLKSSGLLAGPANLGGIGHRVVHGGDKFRKPTRIDASVLATIRDLIPLAPLHNAPNALGIEVSMQIFPGVPQVAVFDTAFHQTLPPHAYRYALPREFFQQHHVRRYGFHGTSHQYVARRAAEFLGRPLESLNLITLHLGNGASAAAIQDGKSIDTSMGLTPLEGLIMGTRCGDIDPAIHFYLQRHCGVPAGELESLLNERSGLKGVCGVNDMREVQRLAESGDADARLALDMYAYRVKKYLGAYVAILGRLDALVFTAGIGENSALVREKCCERLGILGIGVDAQKNRADSHEAREIQSAGSAVKVLVVPTHEELEIARLTRQCIEHK